MKGPSPVTSFDGHWQSMPLTVQLTSRDGLCPFPLSTLLFFNSLSLPFCTCSRGIGSSHMKAWVEEACATGYIRELTQLDLKHGVYCIAASNPWYDEGVSFDWTELDKLVKGLNAPTDVIEEASERLLRFGHERLSHSGPEKCMMTVIELALPWRMQPLAPQAQDWSVFSMSEGSPAEAQHRLFAFQQGPPGQRSVREDVLFLLHSVETQLRAAGVCVHQHLSSFLVFSDDFNHLLQQTAAVHKALKSAGLALNAQASSFIPHRVFLCNAKPWWTVFPLASLRDTKDMVCFTVDMFFQWLADNYVWRCRPPLQVFAPNESFSEGREKSVAVQRLCLFERFVRVVVLPHVARVGFMQLKDTLPEEGGNLRELAEPLVQKKRILVGPQKWAVLDVRLALYHLEAFSKDPYEVLGTKCGTVHGDAVL